MFAMGQNQKLETRSGVPEAAVQRRRNPLELLMNSGLGRLLARVGVAPRPASTESLLDLASGMLSLRGRASGPALASAFFDLYEASALTDRQAFIAQFHEHYPHDAEAIDAAVARWQASRDAASAHALNAASESPGEKLVQMLNLAPNGTRRLLALREDLLDIGARAPAADSFARALDHAFADWFNVGCVRSTGIRPRACLSGSSATRQCTRSTAGRICAAGSSPGTGAATVFSIRRWSTIR
jgi:malonyl-CoA decarboxylase